MTVRRTVGYPSGQREQTVNLPAYAFEGSNPSPTMRSGIPERRAGAGTQAMGAEQAVQGFFGVCGSSSAGRAQAFQA